jgi:metal-sulfur cluster biosynthetic enzyme
MSETTTHPQSVPTDDELVERPPTAQRTADTSPDTTAGTAPGAPAGTAPGAIAGATPDGAGAAHDVAPAEPKQAELRVPPAELAALEDIEEAMRDVVDPELGINVVDLGLVYGVTVAPDNSVTLDMTLTSAACPLTDVIEDQTRSALVDGPDGLCADVTINWVWMPPWGPDKITDDGREQLRALGFNV